MSPSQTPSAPLHVVLVTAPDRQQARTLARTLVGEGLVACANLVDGVTSIYRWEEQVQEDVEVLLVLKTSEARLPALCDRLEALHPYDVPEVLALPVAHANAGYLSWVLDACGGSA
jgi:periplasmic divalent cation tolerance protein